jgi:hypothetical protein
VVQVAQHFPKKGKALSSNITNPAKEKKKKSMSSCLKNKLKVKKKEPDVAQVGLASARQVRP